MADTKKGKKKATPKKKAPPKKKAAPKDPSDFIEQGGVNDPVHLG